MLKPHELELAADLLERASDEFSNHGCNDLELPNTPEMVAMLNEFERINVGPNGTPEEIWEYKPEKTTLYYYDWAAMTFLSKKLKLVAKELRDAEHK